ncbi:helix-turn-helix domain-containing protein [Uliginosibacterium sp. TH139]|uniref:AraC family transcriptional regulator n=1 Tax=Uliginosibacterium sp. TH139 TaxID=2067453 RepID=UPI000C7E4ED3|nr:helix-turn-helix transcriptional regulator [Uliginosibacterium sp. TH139]PLK48023.1 AraC family transcriptional regulator [Uliginosibacterium sp. TH139]
MPNDVANTPTHTPSHAAFVLDPEQPVLSHGRDLEAEACIAPHSHPRGQLLWAAEGVLRVTTEVDVWIVPASHAVWIPGGHIHQLVTETSARTRNLYIDPSIPVRQQTPGCSMLLLTPLMREIILRLTSASAANDNACRQRLGLVAIDEIEGLEATPQNLPAGQDARLRRLIGHLLRHPDEQRLLPELSRIAGASVRTLERLFVAETGMSFRQWRSRLRLLNAIELLRQGKSSTTVAHSLGYRSASAFVAAFGQHFGRSPQNFFGQIATDETP